jgi:hypothetical protein
MEQEEKEESEGEEWAEPKRKYDNGKPPKTQKVQEYYTEDSEPLDKKGKAKKNK